LATYEEAMAKRTSFSVAVRHESAGKKIADGRRDRDALLIRCDHGVATIEEFVWPRATTRDEYETRLAATVARRTAAVAS
jgi:hypothetical protein